MWRSAEEPSRESERHTIQPAADQALHHDLALYRSDDSRLDVRGDGFRPLRVAVLVQGCLRLVIAKADESPKRQSMIRC